MREEEEEPGDEPGGADSASGGQGASSAGAGRELCQSYASFLESNLDEGQFWHAAAVLARGSSFWHEAAMPKRKQEDDKDPKGALARAKLGGTCCT